MSYASIAGRARTNPANPQAHARCDRCGFIYNHIDLKWQMDWRGATMQNKRILVCDTCLDDPQQQGRAIVVPADPVPILNPRVESYVDAETDFFRTLGSTTDHTTGIPIPGSTTIVTQSGLQITPDVIGRRVSLSSDSVMPLQGAVTYDRLLPIISVVALGTDTIQVSCSSAHGLSTGGQVAVSGLSNPAANGFYSVTVLSATAFTYQVYAMRVQGGVISTATTRVVTCLIGVPYDYPQIPVVSQLTAPSFLSTSAAAYPNAPTATVPPSISGTAFVYNTLTASIGTWTGSPFAYSYQWFYADTGAAISGATSLTYVLTMADLGHTILVKVTALNAGGSTTASSAATSIVVILGGPSYKFNASANSQYAPFSFM
jgi:hypothetical protein